MCRHKTFWAKRYVLEIGINSALRTNTQISINQLDESNFTNLVFFARQNANVLPTFSVGCYSFLKTNKIVYTVCMSHKNKTW